MLWYFAITKLTKRFCSRRKVNNINTGNVTMCWYNRIDFIISMPFAVQFITIFKLLDPLRKGTHDMRKKICSSIQRRVEGEVL